jgi:hypothetical protein
MKVICLNISRYNKYDNLPLTVGEVYDVIEVINIPFNPIRYVDYTGPIYKVINDRGELSGYSDECVRLLTVAELRELKLVDLGI